MTTIGQSPLFAAVKMQFSKFKVWMFKASKVYSSESQAHCKRPAYSSPLVLNPQHYQWYTAFWGLMRWGVKWRLAMLEIRDNCCEGESIINYTITLPMRNLQQHWQAPRPRTVYYYSSTNKHHCLHIFGTYISTQEGWKTQLAWVITRGYYASTISSTVGIWTFELRPTYPSATRTELRHQSADAADRSFSSFGRL